jgi:hypothetical protein
MACVTFTCKDLSSKSKARTSYPPPAHTQDKDALGTTQQMFVFKMLSLIILKKSVMKYRTISTMLLTVCKSISEASYSKTMIASLAVVILVIAVLMY